MEGRIDSTEKTLAKVALNMGLFTLSEVKRSARSTHSVSTGGLHGAAFLPAHTGLVYGTKVGLLGPESVPYYPRAHNRLRVPLTDDYYRDCDGLHS